MLCAVDTLLLLLLAVDTIARVALLLLMTCHAVDSAALDNVIMAVDADVVMLLLLLSYCGYCARCGCCRYGDTC